jgi:hypothetical protein
MMNEMVRGGKRGDTACFIEYGVPGVFAGSEDFLIGHEQAVAEEVIFEVLPGFFGRIALWGIGRDIDQVDFDTVKRIVKITRRPPSEFSKLQHIL